MKLRYYLRGLGIGVTVTAIIMSITAKPEEMTDAQIKIRAAQLGMVEQSVLADLNKSEEVVSNNKGTEKETTTENHESTENNDVQENMAPPSTKEDKNSSANETITDNTQKEDTEDKKQTIIISSQNNKVEKEENYILITVESGSDSHTVSKKLYEAGLVNSTNEYDNYLMENGYERKIRAGNHEIPVGASKEEIAKILCRMK